MQKPGTESAPVVPARNSMAYRFQPTTVPPRIEPIVGETPHYRTHLEIRTIDGADAAPLVCNEIADWIAPKSHADGLLDDDANRHAFIVGRFTAPMGWNEMSQPEGDLSALASLSADTPKGETVWAAEYDTLGRGFKYRRWRTRLGVNGSGSTCTLNVSVSHYPTKGYFGFQRPPEPSVPNIVRKLIDDPNLLVTVGSIPVIEDETYLEADNLEQEFFDNLIDPRRELPLILITTDGDGRTPVWDATELSHKLMGMARVYILDMRDTELVSRYRSLFPNRTTASTYRIGESTLAVYQPGIDLTKVSTTDVQMTFSKEKVDRYAKRNRSGFIDCLRQGIGRIVPHTESDIEGIGDVRWIESRTTTSALRNRMASMREREVARAAKSASEIDADGLTERVKSLEEDNAAWEEIATQLEQSANEASAKVDTLTADVQRLESEKRAAERKATQASAVSDTETASRIASALTQMPQDLTQLLDLAAAIWPDRIAILPEAYTSAKSFSGDLNEEWEIIYSAATVLYDMYFTTEVDDRLATDFKNATGYELARGESKATRDNPNLMRLRKRTYNGETVDVSPHIKGRSQKNAFRLHYCVDRDNELIVIGHAGAHMKTAGTPKSGFK